MIRHIKCIRKHPDLSDDEFRNYWHSPEYANLNQQVVELGKATRFSQNLALKVEATQRVIDDRGFIDPFDGVIEYWWDDASQLMELYDSPEARVLREKIAEYENRFIDRFRSTAFFTECSPAE